MSQYWFNMLAEFVSSSFHLIFFLYSFRWLLSLTVSHSYIQLWCHVSKTGIFRLLNIRKWPNNFQFSMTLLSLIWLCDYLSNLTHIFALVTYYKKLCVKLWYKLKMACFEPLLWHSAGTVLYISRFTLPCKSDCQPILLKNKVPTPFTQNCDL